MPRLPQDPHPRTGSARPSSTGDARTLRDRSLATSRHLTRALVGISAALVLGLSVLAGTTATTLGGASGAVGPRPAARSSAAPAGGSSGGSTSSSSSAAPAVTSGAS